MCAIHVYCIKCWVDRTKKFEGIVEGEKLRANEAQKQVHVLERTNATLERVKALQVEDFQRRLDAQFKKVEAEVARVVELGAEVRHLTRI